MNTNNLWIVVATWANDDDDDHLGGFPYAIYAETSLEAIEITKALCIQEEINTDPESHEENPITWDIIDYKAQGEGYIISDPILLTESVKKTNEELSQLKK